MIRNFEVVIYLTSEDISARNEFINVTSAKGWKVLYYDPLGSKYGFGGWDDPKKQRGYG